MPAIRASLFPFDFSAARTRVAPFVRLAERLHATITLLSVVPPFWTEPSAGMGALIGEEREKLRPGLKAHLDESLTGELPGSQWSALL